MFTNAKKNTIFSLPKIYICTRKKICQRKKCVKESNIRYVKIIICTVPVYLLNIESQVISGNSGQVYNASPNYKSVQHN